MKSCVGIYAQKHEFLQIHLARANIEKIRSIFEIGSECLRDNQNFLEDKLQ